KKFKQPSKRERKRPLYWFETTRRQKMHFKTKEHYFCPTPTPAEELFIHLIHEHGLGRLDHRQLSGPGERFLKMFGEKYGLAKQGERFVLPDDFKEKVYPVSFVGIFRGKCTFLCIALFFAFLRGKFDIFCLEN
ncbi:hypothetical protein HZC09_03960, partial [Candidatus Micrarchaeota archaeon]|nr:hypothetical protein [Candidatus Micrarchaeota archaeon]